MKRKRIICGILACVIAIALTIPTNVYSESKFSDTSGHWAENYINSAVNQGIIQGYPGGLFLPDKGITRAEFANMVNKSLGNNSSAYLNFVDVPYGEWYYADVAKAVAATYVAGYDDNSFKPNSPISRQEAAVMISRFIPTYGESGSLRGYSDYGSIADWAYVAMEKIISRGYIGPYDDGKIHPLDKLTRAQSAKILCEIIDHETIVKSDTTVKIDATRLSGKVYSNNVTIHSDLDEGSATIDNCIILGTLFVQGGGVDTVTINNSRISNISINKTSSPVRVLAKGETGISDLTASKNTILQTSSLAGGLYGPGFNKVNVSGSADVVLRGSFPLLNVNGSSAKVTLESGTIKELSVASGGKNSNITLSSGTTVSNATVNAESYYHGTGTISHMAVNADGITYETKPKLWTIASKVDTPKLADPVLDISFSPVNAATNVYLDTKITITFSTAMKKYNGNTLTNSDLEDFITLRKTSSSGSTVGYSASINSAKKIITITPDSNLIENTKYYVTIDKNSMMDSYGIANKAQSTYFTTGTNTSALTTTYSPVNNATTIPVNPVITISLSDSVVRYSNGATISSSDSYLKDCIVFKKTSASGDSVSYSASINSAKKIITITPDSNLILDQKYYVAIVGSKLKTSGGTTVPGSSVTWTTGVTTPVLSTLSLTPDVTTITASVTSNIAGTAYLVALPFGDAPPNAAQVVAGQNSSGVLLNSNYRNNGTVAANTEKSFQLSGFASSTQYAVYGVIYGNGLNSVVKSATTTTTKPTTRLTDLSVIPQIPGYPSIESQITFVPTTTTYNVTLNTSITTLSITAKGPLGSDGPGNITINNEPTVSNEVTKDVSLTGISQSIPISVSKDGTNTTTYMLIMSRTDNYDISSLVLKADGATLTDSGERNYALTTNGAISMNIGVVAADKFATVDLSGALTKGTGNHTFTLDASTTDQTFEFSITSGAISRTYLITFKRPVPVVVEGT